MNLKRHVKILSAAAALLIALQLIAVAHHSAAGIEQPAVAIAIPPPYPVIARHAQASGDVSVEVGINSTGEVFSAKASGGHPLLKSAAERAAKEWRFAPSSGGSGNRTANLIFSFKLMPRCAPATDLTPIFYPPYKVVIRGEKPLIICDDCSPARQEELRCQNP
jgi:TonB family protein